MTHSLPARHARWRQSGIGMIEVLIAVLVVSIGFLGMAALQAKALSTNNSAMARSMATVASYSILDAMRADIVNAKLGAYNGTVTAGATSCPAAGTTLAGAQLNAWCVELGKTLGTTATTGNINCSVVGDCTVTIQFDDSRAGTVGTSVGSSAQKVMTEAGL
ncbi:MAG TPA: type IV pilus modification protein PilV [Rhodanobacteraceae bacterium]|nr:type IV pilus modification protein PilV [Rhodanobacteraceae bacterium]